MARKPTPSATTLAMQGDLDVFSVQAQWEAIRAALVSSGDPVVLDLSAAGDIDLSGLQLLLVLERHLASRGIRLSVTGAKTEWVNRFRPLGLAAVMEGRP